MSAGLFAFLEEPHPIDEVPVRYCEDITSVIVGQVEHRAVETVNCSGCEMSEYGRALLPCCHVLRPYRDSIWPDCR